jgi:hypothetical protein
VTVGRNEFFNRPQYRDYRGSVSWQHAPEHRRGVAYGSALVRDRFGGADRRAVDARRELRSGAPSAVPGRQGPAPQTGYGYRQAPSDPRAASQAAPGYRQAPPDQRGAPALPQVQAQPRAVPPPSIPPRTMVTTPQAASAPVPSTAHVIVTTPQAAAAPPPTYAPAPAQGRAVRAAPAAPAPADAGDIGPSRR